jgi:hypothetical protein
MEEDERRGLERTKREEGGGGGRKEGGGVGAGGRESIGGSERLSIPPEFEAKGTLSL